MKKLLWIASPVLVASFLFFPSCSSSTTTINGNWVNNVFAYLGATRSGAYQFTIGNAAYVGLGYGGKNGTDYQNDSYVFNIDSAYWKEVAPFPGTLREQSVSFSLGGKGYVGLGYNRYLDPNFVELGDFWQFDPEGQTMDSVNGALRTFQGAWKQLNNFQGNPRYNALAFVLGENAYVGTGYDGNFYADCWKYYPGTDTWEEFDQFPGDKREGAMTLTINGDVYYFGGDDNGVQEFDLWKFVPENQKGQRWVLFSETTDNSNYNDFKAGVRRSNACAFTLDDLGYVVCGSVSNSASTLVYQFNPIAQTWIKMTAYERSGRSQAVSFVLTPTTGLSPVPRAFVATGLVGTRKLDDMSEWQPTVAYNATD